MEWMALCDWCGKTSKQFQTVPNGKTDLHLCPMCLAEYELKQADRLELPPPGGSDTGWWQRLKKWFR